MKSNPNQALTIKQKYYEYTTRLVRWLAILIALATFPHDHPRAIWVFVILAIACIYNLLLTYINALRTPIVSLVADNLFVGCFIYLAGGLSSPYGISLILIIVNAVYWYGFKGLLATVGLQSVLSVIFLASSTYHPLILDPIRTGVTLVAGLSLLAFQMERLTRGERNERANLIQLGTQLETERERLLVLTNSLNEATFVVDQQGQILLHNDSATTLLSIKNDLQGQDLAQLLPLTDRAGEPVKLMDYRAHESTSAVKKELYFQQVTGAKLVLELQIAPVMIGHDRSKVNFVVICRDITKEKSLDEQREEFIAVTSHELRTPLAIAEAALSTALLPNLEASPQLVNMIKQAYRNIVFLGELVRDLSVLADAQNDAIPIKLQAVDPRSLIDQLAKDYKAEIESKKLILKIQVDLATPSILTTEHYIREVLQNYLVNAIKYTSKGQIIVSAGPSGQGSVKFGVADTGIGISTSDQKHLFTKFYRSEDYRTRETGGTGLGLYLCLELAKRLNAKVWCESEINKGSTFYLEVPPHSQLKRDRGEVVKAEVSTLVEQL